MIRLAEQQIFPISESSAIAAARRGGVLLAQKLAFSAVRTGELALIITESATNIVKHGEHGHILLRALESDEQLGVEVIAMDAGPGIANIQLHMEDGSSTAGTYGVGLGAIKRLAHEFEIYSSPNQGTVLLTVIWDKVAPKADPDWQIGAICIPLAGEDVCGDAWGIETTADTLTLLVADGLGHGIEAAKASNPAITAIVGEAENPPVYLLQKVHSALYGTRGAAVAIAQIDLAREQLRFAGVGNIAVSVFEGEKRRHLVSHNGIVGANMRKVQEFSQPWQRSILIAHSDGISTRWDLSQYPGLLDMHPGIIAAVLYRDFTRGRDDSTIVVIRDITEVL